MDAPGSGRRVHDSLPNPWREGEEVVEVEGERQDEGESIGIQALEASLAEMKEEVEAEENE